MTNNFTVFLKMTMTIASNYEQKEVFFTLFPVFLLSIISIFIWHLHSHISKKASEYATWED